MDYIDQHAPPRTEPLSDYSPTTQGCTHTTQQLADLYAVKTQTISSWVNRWLTQVAPIELLKQGKGTYTELTRTLLNEFVQVDEKARSAWVLDAKERYAAEWNYAGGIDCEVIPDTVGSALALLSNNNLALQQSLDAELAEVEDFIVKLNTAEDNYSQGEVEQWIANGKRRAVAQFKTEEVIKAQTMNTLRQKTLRVGDDAK
mgnify:CR=1 FL=1